MLFRTLIHNVLVNTGITCLPLTLVPASLLCSFTFLQVFVANPNKTQPIIDILLKNQTKLIDFLSNFQKDRTDDEQFNDEKTYLIKQIRDLKKPAS